MDLNLSEGLQIRAFQKYIFNSRKQEDNETIEDFANTLTRLGANIGAEEQTIVDRFIAGLKNDSARLGILQVGFGIGVVFSAIFESVDEHRFLKN